MKIAQSVLYLLILSVYGLTWILENKMWKWKIFIIKYSKIHLILQVLLSPRSRSVQRKSSLEFKGWLKLNRHYWSSVYQDPFTLWWRLGWLYCENEMATYSPQNSRSIVMMVLIWSFDWCLMYVCWLCTIFSTKCSNRKMFYLNFPCLSPIYVY